MAQVHGRMAPTEIPPIPCQSIQRIRKLYNRINPFYYYNKIFFIIYVKITVSENGDVDHGMSWMNESYGH